MKMKSLVIVAFASLPAPAIAQADSAAASYEAMFAGITADKPGCALDVTRDGNTVIEKTFGSADLERDVPITTATVFEIGSVSKQFTAAAMLLLERDGKLKLSEDIRKYLPEMPDYGTPITIEMLLNHHSGLRDWGSVASAAGKGRGERNFSNAEVLEIAARQKHLNYKPGSMWSYTNTGYNLAAIIVERVSGKSFAAFTRERLFDPLGMTSAQWRDDHNRIVKNRAMAYVPSGAGFRLSMPFMNVYGNGGLMMTISDLTRWNEAMLADELGLRAAMETKATLASGRETPYARGVTVTKYNGATEVSHSGSTGGYFAWLARYPDQKISVAMLCNAPPPPTVSPEKLAGVLLGAAPAPASGLGLPDPAPYAGLFVNASTGMPLTLTTGDGELRNGGRAMPRVSATEWRRGADVYTFQTPDKLHVDAFDGNQYDYARAAAVAPSAEELAAYAGAYVSEEAAATYMLAIEDGQLKARIKGWPDTVLTLSPAYKDAFTSGGMLVRFRRGADGKISEMSLGESRMWDLRATRVR